jgi:hypothetical protein
MTTNIRYMIAMIVVCSSFLVCANMAMAQDEKRFEAGLFLGYTSSEGIGVVPTNTGGGQIVDALNPKSSSSWGFDFNYLASGNFSAGFLWNRQSTTFSGDLAGGGSQDFTDLNVHNYHGILTYHFGDPESKVRPYAFGGLGATVYGLAPINNIDIDGSTRFSTTWGGGVKVFPTPSIGFKATARWTPTYIKSDAEGIYCSPYWPWSCWVVGDPDYSNQLEFSAGVVFRF